MIASGERVFVDSGAWIALAEKTDPLHERARGQWEGLGRVGARTFTSVPVVLETFTFLQRRGSKEKALRWRVSLRAVNRFQILPCTPADLDAALPYIERKEFHKLSLVDATSFVLMRRNHIRVAFAFDTHFATAGFRLAS